MSDRSEDVDAMIDYNSSHDEHDKALMLLYMAGICDEAAVDGCKYADKQALNNLFADIIISKEYGRLVEYLRK